MNLNEAVDQVVAGQDPQCVAESLVEGRIMSWYLWLTGRMFKPGAVLFTWLYSRLAAFKKIKRKGHSDYEKMADKFWGPVQSISRKADSLNVEYFLNLDYETKQDRKSVIRGFNRFAQSIEAFYSKVKGLSKEYASAKEKLKKELPDAIVGDRVRYIGSTVARVYKELEPIVFEVRKNKSSDKKAAMSKWAKGEKK